MVPDRPRLVQLARDECLRLLATDSVGRLAVVAGGAPHILVVNYALDGDAIAFRTAPGTKLDAAGRAPSCFEVDSIDRALQVGWSVVAHGRLEEVTRFDAATLARIALLPVDPWAGGDRGHWMRLVPSYFTGRRILDLGNLRTG